MKLKMYKAMHDQSRRMQQSLMLIPQELGCSEATDAELRGATVTQYYKHYEDYKKPGRKLHESQVRRRIN